MSGILKKEYLETLKAGKKEACPCCGRWAQVYKRSISETVAAQLIRLHHLGGDHLYIHASKLIPDGQSGSGDLGKAKYFGLIVEMPHDKGAKKSSGYWKLTQNGVDYVRGLHAIPTFCYVFDDKVLEFSEKLEFITDTVGRKFDYEALIASR